MNTSILRTFFDRLGGQQLTAHLRGPRQGKPLPRYLSRDDIRTLLAHAPTIRDRLLLSLLYGCGLKVGEAVRLQRKHFDLNTHSLNLPAGASVPARTIPIPHRLRALTRETLTGRPGNAFLFAGRRPTTHLSIRAANRVVRYAVQLAKLDPSVTAMRLRHSFALHALEDGVNPRALQELLGHRSVETTLIYQRCLLPPGAISPQDAPELPSLSRSTDTNPRTRPAEPPSPLSSPALAQGRIDKLPPEEPRPSPCVPPPSTAVPHPPKPGLFSWLSTIRLHVNRRAPPPPD